MLGKEVKNLIYCYKILKQNDEKRIMIIKYIIIIINLIIINWAQ